MKWYFLLKVEKEQASKNLNLNELKYSCRADDIKEKGAVNKDLIIFTQEWYVEDSMCMKTKEEKALSFKKSLDLSTEYDKKAHRATLKKRTFSPVQDNNRPIFSPLLNNQTINVKNSIQANPYKVNTVKLWSKDSESKKSSFLNSEMISKLNSGTFPNAPLSSTFVVPTAVSNTKDKTSKVIPFKEVEEEEESNSTQNPIATVEKRPGGMEK